MSASDLHQLGEALRAARVERGLSARQLAPKVGVDVSTISRMENGLTEPHPNVLGRIAAALEVDVEEFYALAGFTVPEQLPSLPTYLRTKHNLPPDAVARFEQLLREVESQISPTSPEGTRDGDPAP